MKRYIYIYIYIYIEITKTQLHQTNNYFFYKSFQEVSLSRSYLFMYLFLCIKTYILYY
jgi:hypothetical protein